MIKTVDKCPTMLLSPNSFIASISGPSRDRHGQLAYVVKTALVKETIYVDLRRFHETLNNKKLNNSSVIQIRVVTPNREVQDNLKGFLDLEHKPYNRLHLSQNIILHFIDLDEFVKIYSEYNFLEVLRKNLINELEKHQIEIKVRDGQEYIRIKKKNSYVTKKLPVLPEKGDLKIQDVLNSEYMIS